MQPNPSSTPNGKLYFFGTNSSPLVETDLNGNYTAEYIFFNGRRVAMRKSDGSVHYYFADQVGSTNVVTNADASSTEQDIEYHPYGEQQVYTDTLGQEYRFTGHEHDPESGNDYFGARYYSNQMGRFLTPDWSATPVPIPYANPANPQTLNLYSYVENNPVTGVDPDGHCWPPSACAEALIAKVNQAQAWVQRKATATGSPRAAAAATFYSGVAKDLVNGVVGLGTVGKATGAVIDSGTTTDKVVAVSQDLGKAGGIALIGAGVAGGLAGTSAPSTTTVTHFTSDAGVQAITDSGGMLRGGSYVTTPGEIPSGATSGQVESLLEIGPGKGANSVTFETPTSNLAVPENGATTSGGALQFQLKDATKIDPTKFTKTE